MKEHKQLNDFYLSPDVDLFSQNRPSALYTGVSFAIIYRAPTHTAYIYIYIYIYWRGVLASESLLFATSVIPTSLHCFSMNEPTNVSPAKDVLYDAANPHADVRTPSHHGDEPSGDDPPENMSCFQSVVYKLSNLVPTGSLPATVFSTAATAMGGGILGLPSAFQLSGAVAGFIWIVAIGIETAYSLRLLALTSVLTGERSYERMASVLLGKGGTYFVSVMRFLNCFGSMIAYVMSIGDLLRPILEGADAPSFWLDDTGFHLLQSLLWLSDDMDLFVGGNNALEGIGVFMFSYICQVNQVELFREMKKPTVARFTLSADSASDTVKASAAVSFAAVATLFDSSPGGCELVLHFSSRNGLKLWSTEQLKISFSLSLSIYIYRERKSEREVKLKLKDTEVEINSLESLLNILLHETPTRREGTNLFLTVRKTKKHKRISQQQSVLAGGALQARYPSLHWAWTAPSPAMSLDGANPLVGYRTLPENANSADFSDTEKEIIMEDAVRMDDDHLLHADGETEGNVSSATSCRPAASPATVFSTAATAMGGGILGLPSAFDSAGAVAGFIWIVAIGIETAYSLRLLALTSVLTGERSYERMASVLLGKGGTYFVSVMRFINCFGSMIAYVMSIGNLLRPILEGADAPSFWLENTGFRLLQSLLWLACGYATALILVSSDNEERRNVRSYLNLTERGVASRSALNADQHNRTVAGNNIFYFIGWESAVLLSVRFFLIFLKTIHLFIILCLFYTFYCYLPLKPLESEQQVSVDPNGHTPTGAYQQLTPTMLHTREGSDVNNTAEQPSLQDEPVPPTQQDHFHDVGRPGFQENAKGPEMYVQDEDSSSIDEVAEERQVELQRRDETCCDKLSAVVATVIPAGSIVATIFSMCATAIGGGILGVPSAFANSGAVPGVLWLVGIALAGMYSLHLLALAAQTTGESSYERLATVLLGRGGRYFVAGMRLVNCVGSMIAYVMTIGNLIKPILEGANAPDFLLSGSGFKLMRVLVCVVGLEPSSCRAAFACSRSTDTMIGCGERIVFGTRRVISKKVFVFLDRGFVPSSFIIEEEETEDAKNALSDFFLERFPKFVAKPFSLLVYLPNSIPISRKQHTMQREGGNRQQDHRRMSSHPIIKD
eukprot:gene9389-6608_t